VLKRNVVFVDLALAQCAALGATVAFMQGHLPQSAGAYVWSLGFAWGAALLLSGSPGLTVDQLESLLLAAATDMGPAGPDNQYGYGLMNVDIGLLFADGFESGDTSAWSTTVP